MKFIAKVTFYVLKADKHAHCSAAIIFKHIFLENCISIWIELYLIHFHILIIVLVIVSLELKNSSP